MSDAKCKHSWDSTSGHRYCYKCDTFQVRRFNGNYNDMKFWWETISPPKTKFNLTH